MKVWAIWSEGYVTTGQSAYAQYHGQFIGNTFLEAVEKWKDDPNEGPSNPSLVKIQGSQVSYWGCRLFDNEADARKSFG